eukprot:scaffold8634_cov115-Isochrysis_galbana.AAC.3
MAVHVPGPGPAHLQQPVGHARRHPRQLAIRVGARVLAMLVAPAATATAPKRGVPLPMTFAPRVSHSAAPAVACPSTSRSDTTSTGVAIRICVAPRLSAAVTAWPRHSSMCGALAGRDSLP